jgi:hypothetical protein
MRIRRRGGHMKAGTVRVYLARVAVRLARGLAVAVEDIVDNMFWWY